MKDKEVIVCCRCSGVFQQLMLIQLREDTRLFLRWLKHSLQKIKNIPMYQVEQTYIFMYPVKLLMMYFQPSQLQLLGVQFLGMSMF